MTEFNKNKPEIGQEMCYPTAWHGFSNVTKIPKSVADMWLKEIGYIHNDPYNKWLNKQAVVVRVEYGYKVIAVYKHDFSYWIIKLELS